MLGKKLHGRWVQCATRVTPSWMADAWTCLQSDDSWNLLGPMLPNRLQSVDGSAPPRLSPRQSHVEHETTPQQIDALSPRPVARRHCRFHG